MKIFFRWLVFLIWNPVCPDETIEDVDDERTQRLPDALIYGVRKGGTRALLEFLDINPKVSAANREIHFFDRDANYQNGNWSWYREQMPLSFSSQLVMEKTPRYFVVRKAIKRIQALDLERKKECGLGVSVWSCQPIKLVLVVREPVSRLISDVTQLEFKRNKLGKQSNISFTQLVFKPDGRLLNTIAQPVRTSIYEHYYYRWMNNFDKTQLLLIDGQELKETPWVSVNRVEKFLGLTEVVTERNFIFNPAKGFYCIRLPNNTPKCLSSSKGRSHIQVSDVTRAKLKRLFKPFNQKFYTLVGRNFHWED